MFGLTKLRGSYCLLVRNWRCFTWTRIVTRKCLLGYITTVQLPTFSFCSSTGSNLRSCMESTCHGSWDSLNLDQFLSLYFLSWHWHVGIMQPGLFCRGTAHLKCVWDLFVTRFRLCIWGRNILEVMCVLPSVSHQEARDVGLLYYWWWACS